ncbi:hypothetical protein BT96DRAFT_233679 [Gymnopus androsaceus JB14]|uniref:Uncharacterized protein n=1 Tax=Gymnopus androsaceus JB14 TaxID=1447944 RepID=A0A6A4H4G6_9AGAR|nr:hypothetical protein BT96DRAFT_233679 [Gymnopus androsaceus JB14]
MRRSSVNEGMAHHLDLGGSNILGTLALAAHDIDPAIASVAREAWAALTAARIGLVATFAHKAIVDPGGIWEDVCPSPPTHLPTTSSGTSTPQKGKAVKGRPVPNSKPLLSATVVSTSGTSASNANSELDSLETTQDRHARIRVGGLGVLGWVISQYKLQSNSEPMQEKEKDSEQVNGAEEAILSILADPLIWACLSSTVVPPTSSIARSRLSQDTGDDTGAEGDARTGDDDAAEEGNDNDREDIVVPGPGVGQPQVRKAAWRLLA